MVVHSYLLPALSATPEILHGLYMRIPPNKFDSPTHPDRFTPREVIAHLVDWEQILRDERIATPAADPGCAVKAYDEGERARDRNYAGLDVHAQVRQFAAERAKTVELVKSLTPDQLAAEMRHPERGVMTVYDLVNMIVGHDMYHIHQLMAAL